MLWRSRSARESAFQCPRGCPLLAGLHVGLGREDELLVCELARHLEWTAQARKSFRFVSGPAHVAYPPYLAIFPLRTPPLPSPGLYPGLRDLLLASGEDVPAPLAFHDRSHGGWQMEVQPWHWKETTELSESDLELMRRSFRRGAYKTQVPVADLRHLQEKISTLPFARILNAGEGRIESDQRTFLFPSYLITNNEFAALRRILVRGVAADLACAHYQEFLIELLGAALSRREALDRLKEPSKQLTMAERFEGIVRTENHYWKVRGHTYADEKSQETWSDLREPAEMSQGLIYVTRRLGLT